MPYCHGKIDDHLLRDLVLERHELLLAYHVLHQRSQAPGHQVDEVVGVPGAHVVKFFPLRPGQDRLPVTKRNKTQRYFQCLALRRIRKVRKNGCLFFAHVNGP